MVVGEGFEPSKALLTDLQSVPFGHSGTPPYNIFGASEGTRTPNLLITSQLLYQLSHTSKIIKIGDPEGTRTLDLQRDRLAF